MVTQFMGAMFSRLLRKSDVLTMLQKIVNSERRLRLVHFYQRVEVLRSYSAKCFVFFLSFVYYEQSAKYFVIYVIRKIGYSE